MKVEMILTKPSLDCKDGYLITLYINGLFICSLHSLEMIKRRLKIMKERGIYERVSTYY